MSNKYFFKLPNLVWSEESLLSIIAQNDEWEDQADANGYRYLKNITDHADIIDPILDQLNTKTTYFTKETPFWPECQAIYIYRLMPGEEILPHRDNYKQASLEIGFGESVQNCKTEFVDQDNNQICTAESKCAMVLNTRAYRTTMKNVGTKPRYVLSISLFQPWEVLSTRPLLKSEQLVAAQNVTEFDRIKSAIATINAEKRKLNDRVVLSIDENGDLRAKALVETVI